MGVPQSVEALQWLAYIGRKNNNVTHAGNRIICLGYLMQNTTGTVQIGKSLST